jgi:hypothetical protein
LANSLSGTETPEKVAWLTVTCGALVCAESVTLTNNMSMTTTGVDMWNIFLFMISFLDAYFVVLHSLPASAAKRGHVSQSVRRSTATPTSKDRVAARAAPARVANAPGPGTYELS